MIDASKQFPELVKRCELAVTKAFPVQSKEHVLTASNFRWEDLGDEVANNIPLHKEFKLRDKTLAAKLIADLDIRAKDGTLVDKSKGFVLLTLPHVTCRSSYIVNGHEVQTVNQLRLRPGPYTRYTSSNDTETFINAAGGGYRIVFERETGRLRLKSGTSHIDVYPVLAGLGITDKEMADAWGGEVYGANKKYDDPKALAKLYGTMRRYAAAPVSSAELKTAVDAFFRSKMIDPRISAITLGKEYKAIEPHLLLDASKKAVDLANGLAKPDDTESLAFKSIHSIEDFIPEKLGKAAPGIAREIAYRMDKEPKISSLISPATFSAPVVTWFETSEFTRYSEQNNPVDMAGTVNLTTTMGEGGIQSAHAVKDEVRLVHPSHMGFLDPVHSPEGGRIGITGHLALGAEKEGNNLVIRVVDAKTGETVRRTPQELETSVIAFNDQYDMTKAKPKPVAPTVKAKNGSKIELVPATSVQYIFRDPKGFFSIVTNAIPFLHNNSPNRVLMADRHIEQSVPLKDPDLPLVQSRYSGDLGYHDFFGRSFNARSPVDGKVVKITKGEIRVKGDKDTHTVYLHDNYPLNGDAFLHDTPIVQVGDKVKKGQVLADNNFSKDGTLTFSKRLLTAYMPYKGYNFEDGIVISESAAKKLTSTHKYDLRLDRTDTMKTGITVWLAHYPDKAAEVDREKYDADGIIKKGAVLAKGDVVIPAVDQAKIDEEMAYARLHKSLRNPFRDMSIHWEENYPGEVVDVIKTGKFVRVLVKTDEPLQVGDKLSQSAGGKGIVVATIPDNEMYQDEKGRVIDVLFNPASVAGRVNPGQLFEGAAGKIAEKTGKKYLIDNFSSESTLRKIQDDLKANGLKDTENIFDPVGNRTIENVFVGSVPFFKLKHQVRHKFSAKGIGPYTGEQQPAKVSGESAQNIGTGELYALLGGGSTHFLRDVSTIKSQSNPEYWRAYQLGLPTPPPKSPYILDKFTTYLEGAGINLVQDGSQFKALPLTDRDVLAKSKGEIQSPGVVRATDLRPEANGLFDRALTGGFGGTSWSHIALESPMPNPLMERPIVSLTGLTASQFKQIMEGLLFVKLDGTLTTDQSQGKAAGEGIQFLLDRIDVDKELKNVVSALRTARAAQLDDLNRKRRYLQALKLSGLKPSQAYIQTVVPIIPPVFRQIYPLPDGALNVADPNHCYREILLVNNQLKDLKAQGVDAKNLASLRGDLYGAIQGMAGVAEPLTRGNNFQGFIATIKGRTNKYGLFQGRVVKRPQDLSGRSTIIPNPKFGLDDVGIPEDMGFTIYRPFVMRRLVTAGFTPVQASEMIEKKDEKALAMLRAEVKERPVYFNRAPTLHKFGIMAFKPTIVKGQAIQINPLVVKGFNADIDGDTMGIHVPVSEDARKEAFDKMPSSHLMAVTDFSIMHAPSKEYALGIYLMTDPKGSPVPAKSPSDAVSMYEAGKIKINTPVVIGGKIWTAGQVMVNDLFPTDLKPGNVPVTRKILNDLLANLARKHPKDAGNVITQLKDHGAKAVTEVGYSIGLKDLETDYKERDRILAEAAKEAKTVGFDKAYLDATTKINQMVKGQKDNRFVLGSITSGAFGKGEQVTQMIATPVAMADHRGEIIKVPITRSYAEGHDIASYWATIPGSRKGLMEKGLGTQDVGALSKRLVNTTIAQIISETDCGTEQGIIMPPDSREALDRVIARGPFKGQVVTPDLAGKIKMKGVTEIVVRSPLRCSAIRGICSKCYGLAENGQFLPVGFHVGALVGQSVSEPVLQTMLRGFHTGGAISKNRVGFDRIEEIFEMPENVVGKATIAMQEGDITSVKPGIGGGWNVTVGTMDHFVPKELGLSVKKGDKVAAGQKLSEYGSIKPQELLEATGDIHKVRDQIIADLNKEYSAGGIGMRRKLFEAAVKPMTDRAEVTDAGGAEKLGIYRGDVVSINKIEDVNAKLPKAEKIQYRPTLLPIRVSPFKGEDFIGKLMFERPHETMKEAPAVAAVADLAKGHPVTRFAFGSFKKT